MILKHKIPKSNRKYFLKGLMSITRKKLCRCGNRKSNGGRNHLHRKIGIGDQLAVKGVHKAFGSLHADRFSAAVLQIFFKSGIVQMVALGILSNQSCKGDV